MSNLSVQLLAPTTAAATSESFILGPFPAASICVMGLQGSETATVQFQNPNGVENPIDGLRRSSRISTSSGLIMGP